MLNAKLVSFEISGKIPRAVDNDGMKQVGQQSFLTPEIHPEHFGYGFDLRQGASQKMPVGRISFPNGRILTQGRSLVVFRVNGNGKQNEIARAA